MHKYEYKEYHLSRNGENFYKHLVYECQAFPIKKEMLNAEKENIGLLFNKGNVNTFNKSTNY